MSDNKEILKSGFTEEGDSDVNEAISQVFQELNEEKDAYLSELIHKEKNLDIFLKESKITESIKISFLYILKHWNSFSPIMPSEKENNMRKGGGYFLYCNGYGLVIDPGFDFVQNFLEQGFRLSDINGILISHAHNDHSNELESICSLLYRRNKSADAQQRIDLFMNLGSFKKYSPLFDLGREGIPNYIGKIILLNAHQYYKISPDISLFTTRTKHNEIITANYSLGFVIKCNNKLLRFTCNTGWDTIMEKDNMNKIAGNEVDKFDIDSINILIAHVGSIREQEFRYDCQKGLVNNEENKVFYDNHLGILGTICMIRKYKPNLTILSEFGEEMNRIRVPLAKKIQSALEVNVIPGDIGLVIDIENELCYCQVSGELLDYGMIEYGLANDEILYFDKRTIGLLDRDNLHPALDSLKQSRVRFIDKYAKVESK